MAQQSVVLRVQPLLHSGGRRIPVKPCMRQARSISSPRGSLTWWRIVHRKYYARELAGTPCTPRNVASRANRIVRTSSSPDPSSLRLPANDVPERDVSMRAWGMSGCRGSATLPHNVREARKERRLVPAPPSWLPDGLPFTPSRWQLLIGEFDVQTTVAPAPIGGDGLRTRMSLRGDVGVDRVVGYDVVDDDSDSRWPVELRGSTLHVGGTTDADGSEYRIEWASDAGFCGEWRTRQPQSIRDRQPGHPEFATGPFLASRRPGSA
jgi:hypothetical protein